MHDRKNIKLFSMCLFLFTTLYMFRAQCSSSGETDCLNTASGNSHSVLVAEMCTGWKKTHVGHLPRIIT